MILTNKISMIKRNVLVTLLEFFENTTDIRDYVLFAIHTRIDPDAFIRTFLYQNAFFKRFHLSKYDLELIDNSNLSKFKDNED